MGLRYQLASIVGGCGLSAVGYALTTAVDALLYWVALGLGFIFLVISTFLFSQIIVEWLKSHWPKQMPTWIIERAPIFVTLFCVFLLGGAYGTYVYVHNKIEKIQKDAQQAHLDDATKIQALSDQIASLKQRNASTSQPRASSSGGSAFGNVDGVEDMTITNSILPSQITTSLKHAKGFTFDNNVAGGH